jgi:O-antigen/teichoic acid export membrane protein
MQAVETEHGLHSSASITAELSSTEQETSMKAPALEAKAIFVAMTQLGSLQLILALSGLVRNKVAAVYLKTTGMGEWSQIQGVATTVFIIVQCGMIVGLSRDTAAAKSSEERQRVLAVANTLMMAIALVTVSAAISLSLTASKARLLNLLGIPASQGLMLLLLVVVLAPIEGLRNNYLSFLQGVLDIRGIATKRGIAVVLATIVAVPLVKSLGIAGACLQFALTSVLLAVLLGQRCYQRGYRPLSFQWEQSSAISLATLGGASLLGGFAYSLVDVLVRSQLIRFAGLSETGLYQAAFLLSSQVTQIVLGSIGVFSLASISGLTKPKDIGQQLHAMYRVILPISAVGLGLLGLLERPLVQLLFSSQFKSSSVFLPLLLIGNGVQAACWIAGAPLLGCGLVRTWLTLQITGASIRYLTVIALLPVVGIQAIPLAFLLGQAFDLIASLIVCSRSLKIETSGAHLAGIAFSSTLPGALALIGLYPTPTAFCGGVIVLIVGAVILAPAQATRFAATATGTAVRYCSRSRAKCL